MKRKLNYDCDIFVILWQILSNFILYGCINSVHSDNMHEVGIIVNQTGRFKFELESLRDYVKELVLITKDSSTKKFSSGTKSKFDKILTFDELDANKLKNSILEHYSIDQISLLAHDECSLKILDELSYTLKITDDKILHRFLNKIEMKKILKWFL